MLSFIFYVIIKRKRGFCCKPAVDIIKIFVIVKFYCGSRDSFFFPLACDSKGFLRKSSGWRSALVACFRAWNFCLRAMDVRARYASQFRADSRGSRYEGFAGKNWQDGLNGKFWSSAPPTTSSQFNYFIALKR